MKRILMLTFVVLIFLSARASASGFKAIVPDTTDAGEILAGTPFTIDFYGVNDDAGMPFASMPFALYSPDITTITHVNVSGISPVIYPTNDTWEDSSITSYNGWYQGGDGFWSMLADWYGWSWDGSLPDTVNFTGISLAELPVSDTTLYFKFHLQIDQEGTFCIDSIDHANFYYDWMFDFPVSFKGPYCWNIVKPCLCADFTSSTTAGEYPLPVQFTDLSSGYPVSWFWDFGDGIGTSTEQNPQYTYTSKGIFAVSLTISDGVSHNTIVKPDYVTVLGPSVCADFQASPTIGESPLQVQFIDLSTGDPESWFWDFGDGIGTSAEQNPLYAYNTDGIYAVTLTVSDDFDSSIVVKPNYINVGPIAVNEIRGDLRPASFALGQNYPNPFNMQTKFEFALPEQSMVNISIYNVIGQKIKTLADGEFEAGYWEVDWDGTSEYGINVASGLYFYKIETEKFKDTKKLMLLK